MKKITFVVVLALCSQIALAQDGIQFVHDKSWKEVLAMAKATDKLVFLDAYTTWCGPCKKMSKDIFPQEEVGNYYNEHFVNVKMDMEKGEGLQVAETYKIQAYPTLLFIDGDGDLVHRKAGYMDAEEFIDFAKEATDPSRALSSLDAKYKAGKRDATFLKNYTEARYNAADGSHSEIADAYLATQSDWATSENMKFIMQYVSSTTSKGFDYLIKNKEDFASEFGQPQVTQKIQSIIYSLIYYSKTPPSLGEIEKIFQKYFPEKAGVMFANYKMSHARRSGDKDGYAKAAVERFQKYPVDDYSELNETAWTFYEVIEDKALLEKALGWAKKSVKMAKRYENTDTVAHLYYKLGNKRKAKCYAKRAIRLAKKSGDDAGITKELLEKMK